MRICWSLTCRQRRDVLEVSAHLLSILELFWMKIFFLITGQIVSWFNAVPLSALDIPEVSLIHLDVEKHEGEVLIDALYTIQLSRPIIITEGFDKWPEGKDKNDPDNGLARILLEYIGLWQIRILECGRRGASYVHVS